MSKPDKYLSYSRTEVGKCPYRYKKQYIDNEYNATGIQLEKGKFVHELVAEYVRWCVNNKTDGDFESFNHIFERLWREYSLPEELHKELFEQMQDFGTKNVNFQNVLAVEKEYTVEFEPDRFIYGFIDIIRVYKPRGGGEPIMAIIDYKNQANILKQEETLSPQLRIYTLAAMQLFPNFNKVKRGIYYTKYNFVRFYEDEGFETEGLDLKVEIDETRKMLNREWDKLIEGKEYNALQGDWCYQYGGCPIMLDGKCPYQNKNSVEKKAVDDIISFVRDTKQMVAVVNNNKKIIQSYVKQNGNIKMDGKEIGYTIDEDEKFMLKPVVDICDEFGVDISDLEFSKTAMNKVYKKAQQKLNYPDIDKKFSEYKKVTTKTKFKF